MDPQIQAAILAVTLPGDGARITTAGNSKGCITRKSEGRRYFPGDLIYGGRPLCPEVRAARDVCDISPPLPRRESRKQRIARKRRAARLKGRKFTASHKLR